MRLCTNARLNPHLDAQTRSLTTKNCLHPRRVEAVLNIYLLNTFASIVGYFILLWLPQQELPLSLLQQRELLPLPLQQQELPLL